MYVNILCVYMLTWGEIFLFTYCLTEQCLNSVYSGRHRWVRQVRVSGILFICWKENYKIHSRCVSSHTTAASKFPRQTLVMLWYKGYIKINKIIFVFKDKCHLISEKRIKYREMLHICKSSSRLNCVSQFYYYHTGKTSRSTFGPKWDTTRPQLMLMS